MVQEYMKILIGIKKNEGRIGNVYTREIRIQEGYYGERAESGNRLSYSTYNIRYIAYTKLNIVIATNTENIIQKNRVY